MDERQIREIAKVIFQMMKDKKTIPDTGVSNLPIAYVLLSERWQEYDSGLFCDLIGSLEKTYRCILVLPKEEDKERIPQAINCSIITGDDAAEPVAGSVSFFPIPCRNLISKTALCLSDDFDSCWTRRCIEKGIPVHMRKESPMFTGKESAAYQKKVMSYYKDVESYGVHFLEESPVILNKADKCGNVQNINRKYITMADLENLDNTQEFRIREGDVFTDLAREYIQELGVRILEE